MSARESVATRRPIVSVIGDARLDGRDDVAATATELGHALVDAGFRVVTGGLGGVMAAVCRGARRSSAWTDGDTIGVVPSYDASTANEWCDIVIPTGLQLARNVLVVATGSVVVALGGGSGTLSEIALAWQLGRPVVTLGEAGWAGRLGGEALDHRSTSAIRRASSVSEAIIACRELSGAAEGGRDIASGWREPKG